MRCPAASHDPSGSPRPRVAAATAAASCSGASRTVALAAPPGSCCCCCSSSLTGTLGMTSAGGQKPRATVPTSTASGAARLLAIYHRVVDKNAEHKLHASTT